MVADRGEVRPGPPGHLTGRDRIEAGLGDRRPGGIEQRVLAFGEEPIPEVYIRMSEIDRIRSPERRDGPVNGGGAGCR